MDGCKDYPRLTFQRAKDDQSTKWKTRRVDANFVPEVPEAAHSQNEAVAMAEPQWKIKAAKVYTKPHAFQERIEDLLSQMSYYSTTYFKPLKLHMALDWDCTITKNDTIESLIKIANSKHNLPQEEISPTTLPSSWSGIVEAYSKDHAEYTKAAIKNESDDDFLSAQNQWLADMVSIERDSIHRVEESGIFSGLSKATINQGVDEAIRTGEIEMRSGWVDVLCHHIRHKVLSFAHLYTPEQIREINVDEDIAAHPAKKRAAKKQPRSVPSMVNLPPARSEEFKSIPLPDQIVNRLRRSAVLVHPEDTFAMATSIISVNWSATFIRRCLLAALKASTTETTPAWMQTHVHVTQDLVRELQTRLLQQLAIFANEPQDLRSRSGSSGVLQRVMECGLTRKSVPDEGQLLLTAQDKHDCLRAIDEGLRNTKGSRRTLLAYVGDSITDFTCLTSPLCHVPIMIKDDSAQPSDSPLNLEVALRRAGKDVRHVSEFDQSLAAPQDWIAAEGSYHVKKTLAKLQECLIKVRGLARQCREEEPDTAAALERLAEETERKIPNNSAVEEQAQRRNVVWFARDLAEVAKYVVEAVEMGNLDPLGHGGYDAKKNSKSST